METVKYICEFFFDDFGHFISLVLIVIIIARAISQRGE